MAGLASSIAIEATVDVDVTPKRTLRKRKAINYAELGSEADRYWTNDEVSKRRHGAKTIKRAVGAEEVAQMSEARKRRTPAPSQTGAISQSAIVMPPALPEPQRTSKPRPKPRSRARTAAADRLEYDGSGREVRKRTFRESTPENFLKKKRRAFFEPIGFSDRERCDTHAGPREKFHVIGSVGHDYRVTISHLPTCTCPDFKIRKVQCKHIVYVFLIVLNAREELAYQDALLTSELEEIFNGARPSPHATEEDLANDGKRKPIEDQECPICYMELESQTEAIVYCKGTCGNNIHKHCMSMWADTLRRGYKNVTCPYCRQDWRN